MIRDAVSWDIPALLLLAESYVPEVQAAGNHRCEWEADTTAARLLNAIADPSQMLKVVVHGHEVVGAMWALCLPLTPWSSTLGATDIILLMRQDRRGGRDAINLIKSYLQWANESGAVEARLSFASGLKHESLGKLYTRLGFREFGTTYTIDI